jgi:uncharacterized protein (DUF433 family)
LLKGEKDKLKGFAVTVMRSYVTKVFNPTRLMKSSDLVTTDPNILGGTPVFKGTRVPVKSLFEYLESNYTLDEFLECFPSVNKEMTVAVLERSEAAFLSPV